MGGKVAANLKSPELVLIVLVLPLHVAIPEQYLQYLSIISTSIISMRII